jgi:hypothetical protein
MERFIILAMARLYNTEGRMMDEFEGIWKKVRYAPKYTVPKLMHLERACTFASGS